MVSCVRRKLSEHASVVVEEQREVKAVVRALLDDVGVRPFVAVRTSLTHVANCVFVFKELK